MADRSLALVTGASSGIGLELAKVFADHGHDLIVASENRTELKKAAQLLRHPGIRVDTIVCDLSEPAGARELYDTVKQLGGTVDLLASNAGVGVCGAFATETELAAELAMIQVNAASAVAVTKFFAHEMVARGAGRILITCPLPRTAPWFAVHAATNAFLIAFAEALRAELKDTGVSLTALMPGWTATNFFRRARIDPVELGPLADPALVARAGYEALLRGDECAVLSAEKIHVTA